MQSQSRLLQLPCELRQKILRCLLKSPDAFLPLDSDGQPWSQFEPEVSHVPLTAQLLRTCQQMYVEASQILYEENVLHVDITAEAGGWKSHAIDTITFRTFAGSFYAVPDVRQPENKHITQLGIDLAIGPNMHSSSDSLHRFCLALRRMPKLRLVVNFRYQMDIYMCCRTIESVCRGKDVTIQFESSDEDYVGFAIKSVDILRSCKGLRCRSVRFEGLSEKVLAGTTAREVMAVITGDQPYRDLFEWYHLFRSSLLSDDAIIDGFAETQHDIVSEMEHLSTMMETALIAGDADRFMHARVAMILEMKGALRQYSNDIIYDNFSNSNGTVGEAISLMADYVSRVADNYFATKTVPEMETRWQ